MKFLMILGLVAVLASQEIPFEEVLSLPKAEAVEYAEDFADENEVAELVISPEVEKETSIEIDREMAIILQSEEIKNEDIESVSPEIEDLQHLVKRPAVTVSEDEPTLVENPYQQLPISVADKQKINSILTTMAENNVFKLLFQKKQLEKLGRDINHVHPVRFLGAVFTDPRLIHCMYEIRRSSFKWDGFLDGFSQRFRQEVQANNVSAYVPGFAASLGIKPEDIQAYINYNDFEGLVLYLMEKSH